jgi:hypothetical protein
MGKKLIQACGIKIRKVFKANALVEGTESLRESISGKEGQRVMRKIQENRENTE